MNSSAPIKSSLLSFFEPEEIEEWTDPYNLIPLKLLTIVVYLLELWAATVMLIFVIYETKGLCIWSLYSSSIFFCYLLSSKKGECC